jgi:hypothetical protein
MKNPGTATLEHLLSLLADRIGPSPKKEWLARLRDHWRSQASGHFRAFIHPQLDQFVTSDEQRGAVLIWVESVISQPDITPEAKKTAELMAALLRGELDTDASSPLDYTVSGPQPYKWLDRNLSEH